MIGESSASPCEWLSVTNARELAQAQIARDAKELEPTLEAATIRCLLS
jgi:hypothetical protein